MSGRIRPHGHPSGMGGGTMRVLLMLAALAVSWPAAGEPLVLNDFEDGTAPGWHIYEDPAGVMAVEPAPQSAVGDGAVRVRYTKSGRWGYWDRSLSAQEVAGRNAVSFRIRGDGSDVEIVPRIRTLEGESRADPISLSDTSWRQITIRLAHFYPRRSAEARAQTTMFRLTRLGVREPFHFDIDQVQLLTLPEIELEPPVIDDPQPEPNTRVEGPVTINASWRDAGSGVDPASATVLVNTHDRTEQCELTDEGFTLRPNPPLDEGLWHIVSVQVRDRNDNRSEVLRWEFTLGEPIRRPVRLDGDNCVLVDGRPHFAIGLYGVGVEAMPQVSAAGFNTVHSYRWESNNDNDWAKAYLDEALRNNLMVTMSLNRTPVLREEHEVAVERVNALKHHPAILTWHTIDEPDYRERSDIWMPVLYEKIRRADPDHPVSAVICQFRGCERFIDSVDVLQADYYPIPPHPPGNFIGTGFLGIAHMADCAMRASHRRKPFWYVAQGHRREPEGCDPEDVRAPGYDDLKTSAWLAIIRGARGVLWFWYPAMRDQPETWRAIKRVVGEMNELMPLLTSTGPELRGRDRDRHIMWMIRSAGPDTYAVACNHEAEPVTAAVPIPQGAPDRAIEVPTGRRLTVTGGVLRDHFGPFETHIYRLGGSGRGLGRDR